MRNTLNRSSFLWGLFGIALLTASAGSVASAQDAAASPPEAVSSPASTGTAPDSSARARPPRKATKGKASKRQAAPAGEPAPQRYFVEFRSRTAQSYGHTFVVHGPITGSNVIHRNQVAGLHPAGTSSAVYILGHAVPVPAETGWSYGDTEEQFLTAKYRVEMDAAQYQRVAAFIRKMQADNKIWTATQYNCNWFAGEIAQFVGLRVPSHMEYPEDYINGIRRLNGG